MSIAARARALAGPIIGEAAKAEVLIFSKSSCPYCHKVKTLFRQLDKPFETVELDSLRNGPQVQQELAQISGQRTVPNVFVGDKHIGGCDDTFDHYGK